MLYRCPVCGQKADIDKTNNKMVIEVPGSFPEHGDCELAKPIRRIDLSKLRRV